MLDVSEVDVDGGEEQREGGGRDDQDEQQGRHRQPCERGKETVRHREHEEEEDAHGEIQEHRRDVTQRQGLAGKPDLADEVRVRDQARDGARHGGVEGRPGDQPREHEEGIGHRARGDREHAVEHERRDEHERHGLQEGPGHAEERLPVAHLDLPEGQAGHEPAVAPEGARPAGPGLRGDDVPGVLHVPSTTPQGAFLQRLVSLRVEGKDHREEQDRGDPDQEAQGQAEAGVVGEAVAARTVDQQVRLVADRREEGAGGGQGDRHHERDVGHAGDHGRLDGDGHHDARRPRVRDQLGQHERHEEDRGEDAGGPPGARDVHQHVGHVVREPRAMDGQAQAEHAAEDHQDLQVDGAVRLAAAETAARHDHHAAEQGRHGQGHELQRREPQGHRADARRENALAALRRARQRSPEHDQVLACAAERVQVGLGALDEQRVADAERERAEVLAQVRAVAQHAEHDDAELLAQPRLADRGAVESRGGRDHDLGQAQRHVGDASAAFRVGRTRVAALLDELHDGVRPPLHHEQVAGLQGEVLEARPDGLLPADEGEEPDPLAELREVLDPVADEPGVHAQQDLGQVLRSKGRGHEGGEPHAVRQEPGSQEDQVGEPDRAEHGADGQEVEEVETLELDPVHLPLAHDAVHEEVGRRAHEGERATEDRRVGQRQQDAARADAHVGAHRDEHGQQQHHDTGVVHQPREDHHDGEHREEQEPDAATCRVARQPIERVDRARLLQPLGQDEHAGDGEQRRVAEPGCRVVRVEHPADHQQREGEDGHQVERHARHHGADHHDAEGHEREDPMALRDREGGKEGELARIHAPRGYGHTHAFATSRFGREKGGA